MSNRKASYYLCRFSTAPKRYTLLKNRERCLVFGPRLLKMYFPHTPPAFFDTEKGKRVALSNSELSGMEEEERKFLSEEMYRYLASEEKSVKELKAWLARRGIKNGRANSFVEEAIAQNFLNVLRFASLFAARRKASPRPWWTTRSELIAHGVASDEVDGFAYSDHEALFAFYENYRFKNPSKQITRLRSRLIGRGFDAGVVKELAAFLREKWAIEESKLGKW